MTCKDKVSYNKFSFPLVLDLATRPEKENVNGKVYTKASFIKAIDEYKKNRIDTGSSFLGMSKYTPSGGTIMNQYDIELNFWNSIGIIKDIDVGLGQVILNSVYNYDPELWVITMDYEAECIDKDKNLYTIVKIKNFYLSRKFQAGISITDGRSIKDHLMKHRYQIDNIVEMKLNLDKPFVKETLDCALMKFKERIFDVYSMPASVIDENGSRIGLIYNITSDRSIEFISKEIINRFDYDIVPVYNMSGDDYLKIISILNFKLVPKFNSKELETIK